MTGDKPLRPAFGTERGHDIKPFCAPIAQELFWTTFVVTMPGCESQEASDRMDALRVGGTHERLPPIPPPFPCTF